MGTIFVVLGGGHGADSSALIQSVDVRQASEQVIILLDSDDIQLELLAGFYSECVTQSPLSSVRLRVAVNKLAQHLPLLIAFLNGDKKGAAVELDIILDQETNFFTGSAASRGLIAELVEQSRVLRTKGVKLRWLMPILPAIIYRLEGLYSLAREKDIELLILFPEAIDPRWPSVVKLSANDKLFLWDFINYRLLEADRHHLSASQLSYYTVLISVLNGGLTPTSASLLCVDYDPAEQQWRKIKFDPRTEFNSALLSGQGVVADIPGRGQQLLAFLKDVISVLTDGGLAHLKRCMSAGRNQAISLEGKRFERVLLIGAYGGEHIGDAAILGGVLRRLHEQFGTKEAVLMTQRLDHTRHLIPMLDSPVNVTVDIYERQQINQYLAAADCVVFAGGPLIDIPKQLVRHLYAVSLAKQNGKPFIAEGIGPGPFARLPSKYTAQRMISLADRITLRASDSVDHPLVKERHTTVSLCPAFDYLETRGEKLSRLPQVELNDIEALLSSTEGRPVIGINIRPIGHLYTAGAPDSDVAAYTRSIEQRFEQRLAAGLKQFNDSCEVKPCYVFFPMNAIQFGMSDLLSAYRIQCLLGDDIDFRVWQADVSLDGVLAILRRMDVVIAMRFHAAIFALSQQCKVIGIDYRIGKKDKVAGLLDDVKQGDNCARIDLLEADWLAGKITQLMA